MKDSNQFQYCTTEGHRLERVPNENCVLECIVVFTECFFSEVYYYSSIILSLIKTVPYIPASASLADSFACSMLLALCMSLALSRTLSHYTKSTLSCGVSFFIQPRTQQQNNRMYRGLFNVH